MRIDPSAIPEMQQQIKPLSGKSIQGLNTGDEIKVKILFNKDGVIHGKTPDGQIIKAHIEGNVNLPVGSEALLSVTGHRDDGTVVMALSNQQSAEQGSEIPPEARELPIPPDKLEAYANTLRELRLPVTAENLARMNELMEKLPDLSLKDAAFLAANKIKPDSGILQAAKELIAGDAKTAVMLQELVKLLGEAGAEAGSKEVKLPTLPDIQSPGQAAQTETQNTSQEAVQQGQPGSQSPAQGAVPNQEPTWTTWLHDLAKVLGEAKADPEFLNINTQPEDAPVPSPAAQDAQGSQASQNPEGTNQPNQIPQQPDAAQQAPVQTGQLLDTQPEMTGQTRQTAEAPSKDMPELSNQAANAQGAEAAETQQHPVDAGMQKIVLNLLSQMPSFSMVSPKNMEEITTVLLKTAGEFAALDSDPADLSQKLKDVLNGLFTKLSAGDKGQGEALRQAKNELFVRLSFFNEALSSSNIQGKAALMNQTERLLNHVKVMDNIDQFVYMQLPVTLNDEQRNADLYIYKQKKGGKRIDPDNVKILLALDLPHMGHLESFISIRGKDVSLEFEMENDRIVNHMRANTVKLHGHLAEAGFRLADSWVRKAEEESEDTTVSNALMQLFTREKRDLGGIEMLV